MLQLDADQHRLDGYRDLHLSRQVGIIEHIRMTNPLIGHQFQVLAAERMTAASGEIPEGHLIGATDAGLNVMDLRGESIRRHPLDQGIGLQKGAVDALGFRTQDR